MEKYFVCFGCKELLGTVYESSCCGKLYCQKCKTKLINSPCPKCGKLLDIQRNIFAQRMLKNIKVKCKYNCGEILPYDKMKYHQLICDKKIFTCSFDKTFKPELKSSFKGSKKEILNHLAKEHAPILLIFMENHQNFEPILKNMKNVLAYKKNTYYNFSINRDINTHNNDDISDLTNSENSDNIDADFLRGTESVENTSIEFEQDIQLLNGINDLNIINSNLQRFNDLPVNNRNNNNLNNSIRQIGDENLNNNGGNNNNRRNENEINNNDNNNIFCLDLHGDNYQSLRDNRYTRFIGNDNNLDFGYSINNNFHSNNSGLLDDIHNSNSNGSAHGNIIYNQIFNSNNTRNRRRTGNMIQNNLNNNINNNSNNNITNGEGNNIRNLEDTF